MSTPCACVFCRSKPQLQFPVPVLVHHPEHSFWMYMTSYRPMRLLLSVEDAGTYEWRVFPSFRRANLFVCKVDGHSTDDERTFTVDTRVLMRTPGGLVDIKNGCQTMFRNWVPGTMTIPCDERYVCRVTTDCVKRDMATKVSRNVRKRARSVDGAPLTKYLRVESSSSNASDVRANCSADERDSVARSVDGVPLTKHARVESSSSNASDIYASCSADERDSVAQILSAHPIWSQDTVDELLHFGATPMLQSVTSAVHTGMYVKVCCVFVQPCGRVVSNIWLPKTLLRLVYPMFAIPACVNRAENEFGKD